jgi:hypothetical protein
LPDDFGPLFRPEKREANLREVNLRLDTSPAVKVLSAGCLLLAGCLLAGAQNSATSSTSAQPTHPAAKSHATSHSSSKKHKKSSTSSSSWKRGQQKIDPTRANEIQEALVREHYLDGPPSGKWDDASQKAMERYQADNGWQSKTVPDSRALIKMGLGPDHAHLLNPESAMTTASVPQTSKSDAASKPATKPAPVDPPATNPPVNPPQ